MRSVLVTFAVVAVVAAVKPSDAGDASMETLILQMHQQKSANEREHLAIKIEAEIRAAPPDSIDQSIVAELVPLLSDDNDLVIGWLAKALGEIGPRASAAIPELDRILNQQVAEEKKLGIGQDYSSEGNVCLAIYQIEGVIRQACWPYAEVIKSMKK
jgi:hypothetical protein